MNGSGCSSWPTARASEQENRTTRSAPSHGTTHGEVLAGVACDFMAIWGTPRASDGEKGGPNQSFGAGGMPLPAQAAQWTTPSHSDGRRGGTGITDGMTGSSLTQKVAQWPTPMAGTPAQNGNSAAGSSDFSRRADMLAEQVMQASAWPTPAARDWKGENGADHLQNGTGRLHMDQLPNAVAHGFTPPNLPTWQGGLPSSPHAPISRPLWASMIASHGRAVSRRILKARARRRLNPLFVEWLMGWPPGHALCACSATEFTRWQRDMRGALLRLPMASGPWIWAPSDGAETDNPQQMSLFG